MQKESGPRQKEIQTHQKETKRLNDEIKEMKSIPFEQNWKGHVAKTAAKHDVKQFQYLGSMSNSVDNKLAVAKKNAENAAAAKAARAKAEAENEERL